MATLQKGVRGARLLIQINVDRLLSIGLLTAALYVGAWISH